MSEKLLITSASAKIPLIFAVEKMLQGHNIEIMLADVNPNCLSSNFGFKFWKMPYLSELRPEFLRDFCLENKIKYILPTRDGELDYFAQHKEFLAKSKIFTMVSNKNTIEICNDKFLYYKTLSAQGFRAIPTSLDINEIKSEKFVVKERFGAGSRNAGINLDKKEAIEHSKTLQEPIFQPFIKGEEFSIDAYSNKFGKNFGIIVRKRITIIDGEAHVSEVCTDFENTLEFKNLINFLNLNGHSVTQFIKDKEGICHILETNPRVGGASTLAFEAGLKSIEMFIDECNLRPIEELKTPKKLKLIRAPKDNYDLCV